MRSSGEARTDGRGDAQSRGGAQARRGREGPQTEGERVAVHREARGAPPGKGGARAGLCMGVVGEDARASWECAV